MHKLENRAENPLENKSIPLVISEAREFWIKHDLGNVVDEEDFTRGAVVFHDLHGSKKVDKLGVLDTDHKYELSKLSPRQKTSVRRYLCKTKYVEEYSTDSNFIKKFIYAAVDAVVDFANDPFSKKKAEDVPIKLAWDHIKSLTRAHWAILVTCFLAAMTQ